MIFRTLALLCALTGLAPAAQAQDADPFSSIAPNAIAGAIRPGFEAYAARAQDLPPAMDALCAMPGEETLADARSAFDAALLAWSGVEFIRFGPTIQNDRLERTHFWPDPKGIGLRQVQALLAEPHLSATTPQDLAGKSVALQGFPALEFVLFGSGAEALVSGDDPFRCSFAAAIADNLNGMAQALATEWAAEDLAILTPGPDNPAYRTPEETTLEIIQALTTGLEIVGEFKIQPVLGDELADARPRRAIFRRSGQSLATIRANLAGLRALFEVTGFAGPLAAAGHDDMILRSVAFEFSNASRALASLALSLEEAVIDEDERRSLEFAVIVANSLRTSIGQTLPANLGLVMGFNSLDGD